jgi:hypothetical protein
MSKVLYTVWYEVDSEVESEWNSWMDTIHIPAVIRSGRFVQAKRYRVEGASPKYATFYEAKDRAALQEYLDGPAKELRENYERQFGSRSKLSRLILEEALVI